MVPMFKRAKLFQTISARYFLYLRRDLKYVLMTTLWIVASIWEKQDPALKRGVPQKSAGEGVEERVWLEEVPREQFRRRVPEEGILKEFPNRTVQGRLQRKSSSKE